MREEWAQYSESIRIFYSMVLAHLAGVDGDFAEPERQRILELCADYGLSGEARDSVLNAVTMPRAWLDVILGQLSVTGLRFSLLLDVCAMAQADGVVEESEVKTIGIVAKALRISDEHVEAIELLCNDLQGLQVPGADPQGIDQALAQAVEAGLAADDLKASYTLAKARAFFEQASSPTA